MSKISELSDGGSLISSDYLIAVRSGGNVKVRMNQINVDQVDLGDNEFIRLGNSQDLTMVHTSTQSIINQAGIGDLLLQKAGSTKLTINASGIDVTGNVTADTGEITRLGLGVAAHASAALHITTSGTDQNIRLSNGSELGVIDLDSSGHLNIWAHGDGETINLKTGSGSGNNVVSVVGNNVGIGTSNLKGSRAQAAGAAASASPTLGSATDTSLLLTNSDVTYGMNFGVINNGNGWIQQHSNTGTASAYNLLLQPVGGNVGIGTDSPATALHVKSTSAVTATIEAGGGGDAVLDIKAAEASGGESIIRFSDSVSGVGFITYAQNDGGSDFMRFGTASTERLRIDASGKLTYGGISYGVAVDPDGAGGFGAGYNFETNAGSPRHLVTGPVSGQYLSSGSLPFVAWYTGASAGAGTAAPERMRIDVNGNLLVGKTSVGSSFIGSELNPTGYVVTSCVSDFCGYFNRTTTDGGILQFRKDNATVGSIGTTGGGIYLGSPSGAGKYFANNSNFSPSTDGTKNLGDSSLRWQNLYLSGGVYANNASGAFLWNAENAAIAFGTNNLERMRIDASGNLLVGTTTPRGVGATIYNPTGVGRIDLNKSVSGAATAMGFYYNGGQVGSITYTDTSTSFNTSSDQRLKENIADAPSASDDIDAIQVRSFDWKADGSRQKYGMVAQELQSVAPIAVSQPEDPEEMMGVDYSKLVPMLVKEIQSLRARVAQLES